MAKPITTAIRDAHIVDAMRIFLKEWRGARYIMLAPQTMSEKMRMKEMVVRSRACVPLPVSPKVWEMIMAMTKLSAAANIFVPNVFRIFLNTGLLLM